MPTCIIGPVDPCIALCGKQDNLSDALGLGKTNKKRSLAYRTIHFEYHRLIRVLLNCAQKSYSALRRSATL